MKDCVRFAPMIGSREGELSREDAAALQAHLEACPSCRAVARDAALTDGLVGEALMARANARDFAPFVDQVMARVGAQSARAEAQTPARPERSAAAGGAESKGLSWLHRHRRAAFAALAPALAALAVIVYLRLSSTGGSEIAMLEVSSEGEATTILETQDGPVVLLDEGSGS